MSTINRSHGRSVNGEALFSITDVSALDGGTPFAGHPPHGMQYPDEGENRRKRDNFLKCFVGEADIVLNPSPELSGGHTSQ